MPKTKTFRPIKVTAHPTETDFNNLNSNILETFSVITGNLILSGNLVGPLTLVANTPVTVSHGLAKNYTSWFLLGPQTYNGPKENPSPDRSQYIVLECNANATFFIWAF